MSKGTGRHGRVKVRPAGLLATWGLALLLVAVMGCGSPASDAPAAGGESTGAEAPAAQPTAAPATATPTDTPEPPPAREEPAAAPAATDVPPTKPPAEPPTPEPTAALEPPAEPSGGVSGAVLVKIGEGSQARYLVREELANLPLPIDAIGETSEVEGSIAFDADGVVLSGESRIAVNLASLVSDSDRRDGYVRNRTLDTDNHPEAVLVVKATPGLPWPLPAQGEAQFQIEGDFTVREVTRPLTWDVTAQFDGNEVTGTAKTTFTFDDFDLAVPRVRIVLSVEPDIRLELDFKATIE